MKSSFKQIQLIAKDFVTPFRFFLHWNISKIIALVTGYFVGIVLCTPIIVIAIIYIVVLFPEISLPTIMEKIFTMTLSSTDVDSLFQKGFITQLLTIIVSLWYLLFIFWKTYGYVLNLVISKFYLHGKKVKFKDLILIHVPTLKKYAQIFLWNSLFLSLPIIAFFIIFWIFLLIAGWLHGALSLVVENASGVSWFSVGMLITLFTCWATFAYINFRIIFSVFLFVESEEFWGKQKTTALEFVKKSVWLTGGWKKIFFFLAVFISLGIVTLPVTYTVKSSAQNVKDGMRYVELVQYASMSWVTLPDSYTEELSTLSDQFKGKSWQQIIDYINTNTMLSMLSGVFSFFVTDGLIEFFLYSYFFHVLLQKKNQHD